MDSSSGEEDNSVKNGDNNLTPENQSRPKRKMKTPFQLEILEKAYADEAYPKEPARVELSEKLGLTDRQLQMWFCHRRLKDKRGLAAKRMRIEVGALEKDKMDVDSEHGLDSVSGSSRSGSDRDGAMVADDAMMMQRRYKSVENVMELRAIAAVKEQLGDSLREDGPILGLEFDPLPPDAFGAPMAPTTGKLKEPGHYENNLHEQMGSRSTKSKKRFDEYGRAIQIDGLSSTTSSIMHNDHLSMTNKVQGHLADARSSSQQSKQEKALSSPIKDNAHFMPRDSNTQTKVENYYSSEIVGVEHSHVLLNKQSPHMEDVMRIDRKRKSDEVRTPREVEAYEERIRKDVERQDILRRKMEEQMRKEMDRQDRERRKEEERLMREKQRDDERLMRENRREFERREKFLQKESMKAEKRRQKEEDRREREAVRQKAAVERASARKVARETMELIEDERLELMELAASSKGFSSITSLDHDTLQNIDFFRDSLSTFPPISVKLKWPFGIHPWNNSDANTGNLLMVWRFLINFADVLELWPFTLDEFIQALHDYDSRMLGEVHVALLKLIIKDIEDVARTPSVGNGTNQGGGVSPEGGHPHIVEGAYSWGFSIRSWQRHLSPLTWPEILRQMALSAGLGPRFKKKIFKQAYMDDNIEGKNVEAVEDIISTLRNGSAAENAVAKMQERGASLPRRPRHRLTPGTVKYAAFHVLSLEGSKGLMISELAVKIQKSGLRDLSTSKTPDASIGVAMSRDPKLFERIAPSTYRVKTAFRKDPADAEALLSAAREKLQVSENGFLPTEDADGFEKDEDSECDAAEGSEIDVVSTTSPDKNPGIDLLTTPSDKNKDIIYFDEENTLLAANETASTNESNFKSGTDQYVPGVNFGLKISEQEITEVDESNLGQLWVQGLAESEYSDLSVEERINALVALIGIANEGNTIRVVLEDRLETANALRKQMWAEAQLDKRRLKEEFTTKFTHPAIGEGTQDPLPIKDNETSTSETVIENSLIHAHNTQNQVNFIPTPKTIVAQDLFMGQDNLLSEQNRFAAEKSRVQLKSFVGHQAEEMYVYRSLPLGQDRRRNRYWQFVTSASKNDPGSGRIFIELNDGRWRLIDTEQDFDALLMSLETRGIRESNLNLMLKSIETAFKENAQKKIQSSNLVGRSDLVKKKSVMSDASGLSSSLRIEIGNNGTEKAAAFKRYQNFQRWIWQECFIALPLCAIKYGKERCAPLLGKCDSCLDCYILEDNYCCSCLRTKDMSDNHSNFREHATISEEKMTIDPKILHDSYAIPVGLKLLKSLFALIEVSIPVEALHASWLDDLRKNWGMKLHVSSSYEDLLKILTMLECTIKRDSLSLNFETTQELLHSFIPSTVCDSHESVSVLPWIPQTSAGVALRLLELDSSILYVQNQKPEPSMDNIVPAFVKLIGVSELNRDNHAIENTNEPRSRRRGSKFGRCGRGGGRSQGKSSQRRVPGPKSKSSRQTPKTIYNFNAKEDIQENDHVSGWGRRIVRGRRTEKNIVKEATSYKHLSRNVSPIHRKEELPPTYMDEHNRGEYINQAEVMDDSGSAETVESDDDNVQATISDHGGWGISFSRSPDGRKGFPRQVSDEEMDNSEEENDSEEANLGGVQNRPTNQELGFESEFSEDGSD